MRQRAIISIFVTAALIAAVGVMEFSRAGASSHREAPGILSTPDFYMFRSYEEGRDGFVTLIANYIPLQDPYGGPNYFAPDTDARHEIHITNDGDAEEDITFRFQFQTELRLPPLHVDVGGESVDVPLVNVGPFGAQRGEDALTQGRSYSLELLRGNVNDPDSIEFVTNVVGGGNPIRDALRQYRRQIDPRL